MFSLRCVTKGDFMERTTEKTNWFKKLWNYYSTYEKIWLISICSIGILFGIFFPEDGNSPAWLRVVEIIAIIGGCSCELLLSKQSKWAFIVSFFLYDTTQTIVYFANGLYISALFEIIFWIPILFISFHFWEKKSDAKNKLLTSVKEVNYKRDLLIFLGVLAVSLGVGVLFTQITVVAEGLSEYWYLDGLANAFSVCNGLFLLMRFKEQWIPWLGVAVVEAILWILNGQFIMLVLSLGYIMNSIYGFIKWTKYIKTHPNCNNETFLGKELKSDEDTKSTETSDEEAQAEIAIDEQKSDAAEAEISDATVDDKSTANDDEISADENENNSIINADETKTASPETQSDTAEFQAKEEQNDGENSDNNTTGEELAENQAGNSKKSEK